DRVVFEIAGNTFIDNALLDRLSDLTKSGYSIALDNFVYNEQLRPLIELSNIVKLDIQALGRDAIAEQSRALRAYQVKLLAEKVETHQDYRYCKELGFDYYQGYFFCKPQVVSETKIPFNRISTLNLLSKLQDPRITID